MIALAVAGVFAATSGGGDTPTASGGDDASTPTVALPTAKGYKPSYSDRACPEPIIVSFREATCGQLAVPKDRDHPENGRQVHLLVIRAAPRGEVTEAPVLDFGADGLAQSPVRDHAEELRLVQRGFDGSEPVLKCPAYAAAQTRHCPHRPTMRRRSQGCTRHWRRVTPRPWPGGSIPTCTTTGPTHRTCST